MLLNKKGRAFYNTELRFAPSCTAKGTDSAAGRRSGFKGIETADIRSNLILCFNAGKEMGGKTPRRLGFAKNI